MSLLTKKLFDLSQKQKLWLKNLICINLLQLYTSCLLLDTPEKVLIVISTNVDHFLILLNLAFSPNLLYQLGLFYHLMSRSQYTKILINFISVSKIYTRERFKEEIKLSILLTSLLIISYFSFLLLHQN